MRKIPAFSLIELLVVIVILAILASISVSSFQSYLIKSRDAERFTAIQNLALMIKMDSGDTWDCGKYNYVIDDIEKYDGCTGSNCECEQVRDFEQLLIENDYTMPEVQMGYRYYYGFLLGETEGDNEFFVLTSSEAITDDADNPCKDENAVSSELSTGEDPYFSGCAFVEGTKRGVDAVTYNLDVNRRGLNCDGDGDWIILRITEEGDLAAQDRR